jgi:hypothetical protein
MMSTLWKDPSTMRSWRQTATILVFLAQGLYLHLGLVENSISLELAGIT